MKNLFFVSATRGRKEETELYKSLFKLGTDRFVFFEDNRKGLPVCYNQVLDAGATKDEIVIFIHDDVSLSDVFVSEKLNDAITRHSYSIIGLAGAAEFRVDPSLDPLTWINAPPEQRSGAVEHALPDGSVLMSMYGPTPRRCVVLDGLFLAVDTAKIGDLRFDQQFEFHFYDLDFCLRAHQQGIALGTSNIHVTHRSTGDFASDIFKAAQERFRSKWKSHNNISLNPRRNDLCLCGSGKKYKYCHGKIAG